MMEVSKKKSYKKREILKMYSLSIYGLHQDLKATHSDSDVWSKCCQFRTQQACQLTKQTENTCKNIRNKWIGSSLPF